LRWRLMAEPTGPFEGSITPQDLRDAFSALEGDLADLAEIFAELSTWCRRATARPDLAEGKSK
jgi:hypothetical protein